MLRRDIGGGSRSNEIGHCEALHDVGLGGCGVRKSGDNDVGVWSGDEGVEFADGQGVGWNVMGDCGLVDVMERNRGDG